MDAKQCSFIFDGATLSGDQLGALIDTINPTLPCEWSHSGFVVLRFDYKIRRAQKVSLI